MSRYSFKKGDHRIFISKNPLDKLNVGNKKPNLLGDVSVISVLFIVSHLLNLCKFLEILSFPLVFSYFDHSGVV